MFRNIRVKNLQWLVLMICLMPKPGWSQYAIKLDTSNTFRQNQSYLIDVAIPPQFKSLFIADSHGLIPVIAFQTINEPWRGVINSIVIKRPAKPGVAYKITATAPPMTTYLLIQKRGRDYEPDTVADTNHITQNTDYLYSVKPFAQADSVLIYYSEDNASSACCDIKPDTNTLIKYTANFEKTHHVTAGETFAYTYGDEGEYRAYLTLAGLTQQQKIKFIDGRRISVSPDDTLPAIYRPTWLSVSRFKSRQKRFPDTQTNDPDMVYMSVDNPPYYPKGQRAFRDYIYRKMNLPVSFNGRIIISFIVNKDGTLTDARVERALDDKLNEKIIDVLSHAPKWKPGSNGGKVVRVKFVMALNDPR